MPIKLKIPFKDLDSVAWRRLAIAAVTLFYLINLIYLINEMGVLNGVGTDYLAFWSVGKIANQFGYSHVYNLDLLKQIEYDALGFSDISLATFRPIPAPYFSIFILPIQLFSLLNPRTSFWLWTVINLIVMAGYLLFFLKKVHPQKPLTEIQKIFLIFLLISYPVYVSFREGQVEVLQLIFCGEFIRAALDKKPILCGAWLAGMLIKPQILLLILPALFLMRHWKVMVGFIVSSVGILFVSFLFSGVSGLVSMVKLWFAYVPGIASNSPDKMVNWRMLAVNLNNWTGSSLGWIFSGIGMLVTLFVWFKLCQKKPTFGSVSWVKTFLAIFAASCAFTWHSHIHMGMVLLPFFILLILVEGSKLWERVVDFWFFSYPTILTITYFFIILLSLGKFSSENNVDGFILGSTGLFIYMLIALAVLKETNRSEMDQLST